MINVINSLIGAGGAIIAALIVARTNTGRRYDPRLQKPQATESERPEQEQAKVE
jgi:hypothetical protein